MSKSSTILLIDDDKDDRDMLEEVLKHVDSVHKIETAKDGIEGLEKLELLSIQDQLPCLLVVDINMPKMDGKQTVIKIKNNEKYQNIPIVVFSTSNSNLDRMFFEKLQVEYMVKPLDYEHFKGVAIKMLSYCNNGSK